MKVLLVGASGRVGTLLMSYWNRNIPEYFEIVVQHRNSIRAINHPHIHWDLLKMSDAADKQLLALGKIDALVSFAGAVPNRTDKLEHNAHLADAILNTSRRLNIQKVIVASSSAVYGWVSDGKPFKESDKMDPLNGYGISKVEMERICEPYRSDIRDVCCLRIGNVAGADSLLLNSRFATAGKPLIIDQYDNKHGPLRSYIGIQTLARILEYLICTDEKLPSALNVSAPTPVYMEILATAAACPWHWSPAKNPYSNITLNCGLLESLFSFLPDDSDPKVMLNQLNNLW